jgi:hypothetical protein
MKANRKLSRNPRISGIRSPRLIVIASEGMHTEKIYFEDMASVKYYRNPGVHVEVLERDETASSPEHVIITLDNYRKKYSLTLNKDDELWLVIDRDRWKLRELSSVATKCYQKSFLLACSNPCFELWLLLHIKSLSDYSKTELDDLTKNKHVSRKRTLLEQEIINIIGSYNKQNPDTSKFLPFVETAISRARTLDSTPTDRWPNCLGTRVYKLAESILNR